jgi:hypothetical protein
LLRGETRYSGHAVLLCFIQDILQFIDFIRCPGHYHGDCNVRKRANEITTRIINGIAGLSMIVGKIIAKTEISVLTCLLERQAPSLAESMKEFVAALNELSLH